MSGGLHWVGPWACLWDIITIKLIHAEKPSALWAASFPQQWIQNDIRGGTEMSTGNKASMHVLTSLCKHILVSTRSEANEYANFSVKTYALGYGQDMTSCLKFCLGVL